MRRHRKLARAGLYGAVLTGLALPAHAAMLQVVVTGVQSSKGAVMVAVCTEREFLQPHCSWNGRAPAHPGEVTVVLEVPPGTYAVQAFQDEDGNGNVTMNLLGMPVEPIGFSNNPTVRFSAPRWRDAAFQLGAMGGRIQVALRRLF